MSSLGLLTLALAAFAIGTTELSIQGLLPEIAVGLGVTVPVAGLLVTGYALGVAIGGPVAAIAINTLTRKTALLVLLGVFVIGQVLCAVSPNYAIMMFARIVAACSHGAFMGIGSVVAVSIVPAERRASAIALFSGGIASANILGVPAGTVLGHLFGWRSTFWAIAVLGLAAAAALVVWLPDVGSATRTKLSSEIGVLGKLRVVLVLLLAALVCAATFSVFTYIAPVLLGVTGIRPDQLPLYLLLFGVGGVVGLQIGGRFADRNVMASIIGAFAVDAIVYLVLLFTLHNPLASYAMMLVWGVAFYFMAPPLYLLLFDATREAPNLASTLLQSAFNLGIAVGPIAGASVLSVGLGFAGLPWSGLGLSVGGIAVALWAAKPSSATSNLA